MTDQGNENRIDQRPGASTNDRNEDENSDSKNLEDNTEENQVVVQTNTSLDCESKISKDVSVQTNSTLKLSTQKSILINRNKEDPLLPKPQSTRNSFTASQSTESGAFQFFKTLEKNENVATAQTFIYMAIPPDGGYAWLILAMAFVCQAIVDGIVFSIGILLPSIASELSLSYKQTALVASTQIGIYYFTAPIGSAFINKFGFRPVAITGSLIASTAIFIASFSQQTVMLVIFYGIIAGPAMGMIWVTTSLIINYYFERFRAVVGGVASAGSGVGVICVSILNNEIVDDFGWRAAARLHVILLLIAAILVCTYRPIEPTKIGQISEINTADDSDDESICSTEIGSNRYSVIIRPELLKGPYSAIPSGDNMDLRINTVPDLPPSEPQQTFIRFICPCCDTKKRSSDIPEGKRYEIGHEPLGRDDIFYDGPPNYVQTVSNQRSDLEKMEVFSENDGKVRRTISYSLSVIRRPSQALVEEDKYSWIPAKIKTAFYALFDLQLLKLAEFRLLLLDSFFFPMGFNIPFIYCTERAQIDEDYADLLPVVIGFTNVVFRISMGFIAYKIKFHTAYLAGLGMILGGFVTLLSGFTGQNNEIFQFLFALCFGIAAASYSALRAMIYVKVLGLERLTNAFGLTTMVMGIGVFTGTNIAGVLNDLFAGYWVSFVFSGTCMTISGILKLCIPKYVEYRKEIDGKKDQRKVRFAKGSHKKRWWQKCFS